MYRFEIPDAKKVRVFIDTDAACEADDPFAIAHALLTPKLIVTGIIATHYAQPDSMEKSYAAIHTLLAAMRLNPPVYRGERWPLDASAPVSEGVAAMIAEARRADRHPLFLLCQGALTNVARAFAEAPDIIGRVTVITIGGRPYENEQIEKSEFNFVNDVAAANAVLGSGAELWQVPRNVYASMRVSLAELQRKVLPCGNSGEYLFRQMVTYNQSAGAGWTPGESWALGDSPVVGLSILPTCGTFEYRKALKVDAETRYTTEELGPTIRVYRDIDARFILEDFFAKLALHDPA